MTGLCAARSTVRATEPRCSPTQPWGPRRPTTTSDAVREQSTSTSAGHWWRTSSSTGTVGWASRNPATASASACFCSSRHSDATREVMMSS